MPMFDVSGPKYLFDQDAQRRRKEQDRMMNSYIQQCSYIQQQLLAASPYAVFADPARKEKPMLAFSASMLERLRNVPALLAAPGAVDALVELAAYGRQLSSEYELQNIPKPKWLDENLRLLATEIKTQYRADLERQLREAEAEVEALRSREEKRAAKEDEVKRLREQLGAE